MIGKGTLRQLERGFFVTGLAAAFLLLIFAAPAVLARMQSAMPAQGSVDGNIIPNAELGASYLTGARNVSDGTRIGMLSIPALHLNAPVVEGVSDTDLRRGVGHVPGSAQSGGLGNVVLAAHRDAIFRPIRDIRKGMDIGLSGTDGTYHYQVDSMKIVSPDQLDVMDISNQPEVTLITCYPFNFIGSAPMRYIVKAHLVSAMPF
ncbi:MAG: class D sortase [Janthinobacterium lividum]